MNEEELQTIWKKEKSIPLKNLNTELISQRAFESQNKLRKKIKLDIALNILLAILFSPLFYFFPKSLIVLPFWIASVIWYLWEILRIYKHENNFHKSENIKDFIAEKEKYLSNYIKRTRLIGYLGTPIVFLICYIGMTSFEHFWQTPLNFLLCLTLVMILEFVLFEIYIRKMYKPTLDELRELLQQLNDNNVQ